MDTIDLWARSKLQQIDQSKKQEQLFQNNLYLCMRLIKAAGVGDIRKINLLLKEEMDNLLYRACARGYKSAVEELLSQGASVNYMAEGGSTPLHAACIRGHKEVVIVLINNGANVDTTDDNGQTPLRGASVRGYEDIVEVLENKKTGEKKADEREAKNKEVEDKYAEGKRKRGRTTGKKEIGKTDMPKRRRRKIDQ